MSLRFHIPRDAAATPVRKLKSSRLSVSEASLDFFRASELTDKQSVPQSAYVPVCGRPSPLQGQSMCSRARKSVFCMSLLSMCVRGCARTRVCSQAHMAVCLYTCPCERMYSRVGACTIGVCVFRDRHMSPVNF